MSPSRNGNHADAILTACKACCKLLIILILANPIFTVSRAQKAIFPLTELAISSHPEGGEPIWQHTFVNEYNEAIKSIENACSQFRTRVQHGLNTAKIDPKSCSSRNGDLCFPNNYHYEQLSYAAEHAYGNCSAAIKELISQQNIIKPYLQLLNTHQAKYESESRRLAVLQRQRDQQREQQNLERNLAKMAEEISQAEQKFQSESKNIDIIAQVLNYSSGLKDEGSINGSWVRKEGAKCVYTFTATVPPMLGLSPIRIGSTIDLNEVDPASIRFEHRYENLGFGWDWNTTTFANDKPLVRAPRQIDLIRLRNGWSKVLNQCQGKRRAF